MHPEAAIDWYESNQRYLMAALDEVRSSLPGSESPPDDALRADRDHARDTLGGIAAAMPGPPALKSLCTVFELSPFERAILLLCAGMELDGSFAHLCAKAQSDAHRVDGAGKDLAVSCDVVIEKREDTEVRPEVAVRFVGVTDPEL